MKKLSWVKSQKMKREDVEMDLEFVGFIIFENKLKPTTAAVLKELNQSNIGSIMVTGDNILTAISVARNCGLVERNAHCFVPHFAEGNSRDPNARLEWESIDDAAYQLDNRSLLVWIEDPSLRTTGAKLLIIAAPCTRPARCLSTVRYNQPQELFASDKWRCIPVDHRLRSKRRYAESGCRLVLYIRSSELVII